MLNAHGLESLRLNPGCNGGVARRLPSQHARGFTIIELLVVIAVTSLLIALLLPAVQQARESARSTKCKNHLHQIGIALHSYHDVHRTLPPGSLVVGPAFPLQSGWGWGAFILPHLEQSTLYNQLNFNAQNAIGSNRLLISQVVPTFVCPSDTAPPTITALLPGGGSAAVAHGNYPGVEGMLFPISSVRFAHVSDGLSQTLMVGELVQGRNPLAEFTSSWCGVVTDHMDHQFNASLPHLPIGPGAVVNSSSSFNSRHPGGTHFLAGDASVHFLSASTDSGVYLALGTINGGEVVDSPF